MLDSLLAAYNVTFAYGEHTVLRDIPLDLTRGDLVGLIGPNGSGKTTLLKILSGILNPARGTVTLDGQDLRALARREIARRIALVPQELNVTFAFTVREMVMLGRTPHIRALAGETRQDRAVVDAMLELTEMRDLADRLFVELSGGERQRVVIAMALAQEPQILLLDEPTVHLDINHQIEILELILKLNRARGLTVLATMHDLNLAALYFDRLALLNDGCLVSQGTPRAVLQKPRIEEIFRTKVIVTSHPLRLDAPQVVLVPSSI
jgi:iron complex transport system ATP-binding protein